MESVLVTGGAGYIGSHVCKSLHAAGYLPVCFDNLCRGNEWAVKWGPLERGDVADTESLCDVIRRYRTVGAIHLAGYAYIHEAENDPLSYFSNNVAGSLSLFRAVARTGIGHVVFSSTCATYGLAEAIPIPESQIQRPINAYGRSKLMVEDIMRDLDRCGQLRFTILRYFNAAGADPDGEIGEHHDPEPHVIPNLLAAAARGGVDFNVLGTDYDTPDGSCVRDYIHVGDVASAHVLALEAILNGRESAIYNLGTGRGVSVFELIAAVERVTGKSIRVTRCARRVGDPPILVADPTRARAALGWTPRCSDLDSILSTAWAWSWPRLVMR